MPKTGPINRIFVSRFEPFQGVSFAKQCLGTNVVGDGGADCVGEFGNKLQPYAIYVPKKPRPANGYGLTLLLHSLGGGLQPVHRTPRTSRSSASAVPARSSSRRGRVAWTAAMTSFRARTSSRCGRTSRGTYQLDPSQTVVAGYSMGGLGSFKLAEQFPDLFARMQPTVGAIRSSCPRPAQHPGADVERRRPTSWSTRRCTCRPPRRWPIWATATSSTSSRRPSI